MSNSNISHSNSKHSRYFRFKVTTEVIIMKVVALMLSIVEKYRKVADLRKDKKHMGTVKAVAVISGTDNVKGFIQFIQQTSEGVTVTGRISGLSPGLHGFHIHALGDTTNGCNSTGPHFNPLKKDHGSPLDEHRHAGDLGNIVAGSNGVAEISIIDKQISLSGQHSILGRAVVVHADPDDLGRGGHELSKTTGNAGARVGCGIIGLQSSV